ncbi:hypothetical protein DC083_05565 [Ignatzschineria ureiclastica]|uniref:Starvation-inducible protein n=1 Tax=Ignatzschineria ureiclastica TaxID=472582 RepID=A0A2U2AFC2_9GAMM|nr:Slp family lipoprotein [Ignatzschineria ureiclastica]PWD81355.1 hypothetical protein DC083_05565 [Ignatzschineria ureiclastica]
MWQRLLKTSTFLLLTIVLGACASLNSGNISTNNPNAYGDGQITMFNNKEIIGKEFMLGGSIVTINPQGDHIRVEVVLYTLDQNGYPMRNQPMDQYRMIADIYGPVRTNGYSAGDYFTAVGLVKQAENVKMGGETIRVITLNATDYDFWRILAEKSIMMSHFLIALHCALAIINPIGALALGLTFPITIRVGVRDLLSIESDA